MPHTVKLEAAVYKNDESGIFIARGLRHDFIGEGGSEGEALDNLSLAVRAEFAFAEEERRPPFEGLPKTPSGFLAWWEEQGLASQWINVAHPASSRCGV